MTRRPASRRTAILLSLVLIAGVGMLAAYRFLLRSRRPLEVSLSTLEPGSPTRPVRLELTSADPRLLVGPGVFLVEVAGDHGWVRLGVVHPGRVRLGSRQARSQDEPLVWNGEIHSGDRIEVEIPLSEVEMVNRGPLIKLWRLRLQVAAEHHGMARVFAALRVSIRERDLRPVRQLNDPSNRYFETLDSLVAEFPEPRTTGGAGSN